MDSDILQEGISKDIQIKILEEKLAFTQRQLEEKDKQLDHYRQLLKAMQEILAKQSQSPPKDMKTPPGLTPIKNNRKYHSFHLDASHPVNEEDNGLITYKQEDFEEYPYSNKSVFFLLRDRYERDIERRQLLETELALSPGTLKKSKSSNSLSQHLGPDKPSNSLSASTSALPNLPKGSKSPSSQTTPNSKDPMDWKTAKLKKSQSMTSVYSALDEHKLDLKFPDLEQMVGQIYQLSKYQQGCRFLQKKLEEDNKNSSVILKELSDHLVELMTDPFGNYLFTKLVEHCNTEQREELLKKILPEINTVAFDMYGTQSMQKIMPLMNDFQIDLIINALKPQALALIKHNKANYLVQYCLDKLSDKQNQWIYDAVSSNIQEISRDRVGCVIVKRCVDHATEQQKFALMDQIIACSITLIQDPFGNYVVQHILQKVPSDSQSARLITKMLGNLNELCIQKFSSNVVEKCLKVADDDTRGKLLAELTDSDMLPQLLNDRFANFVIQTALDVADAEQRSKLVKNILPHLGKHYSPYTKRLQKKILQV